MEHFKKIARWNEVTLATPSEKKSWQAAEKTNLQRKKKKLEELNKFPDSTRSKSEQADLDSTIAAQQKIVKQLSERHRALPTTMAVSGPGRAKECQGTYSGQSSFTWKGSGTRVSRLFLGGQFADSRGFPVGARNWLSG